MLLATLVSQGLNGGEIFLVERKVPEGLDFEGRFIGGDGYLLLTETDTGVSLKGSARVRSGRRNANVLGKCVFFANDEPGATVHIDATYVPWVHEVLPGGFRRRRAERAGGAA